ncbi:hypothetical protein KC717_05925 [Candidatus Dojkabacteria bacterium]|uniref:Uncharacterized protein n=1 Tax=Candidatus Dojkabacteria bacterium TaxID=2099670 RepID=A0A955RLB8_9BACT|nr:hypothetical protein [Candidatus Dojkabacteria bacterium]
MAKKKDTSAIVNYAPHSSVTRVSLIFFGLAASALLGIGFGLGTMP